MAQDKLVKIYCVNTRQYVDVPIGSTLTDIFNIIHPTDITLPTNGKVNNVVVDMEYAIYNNQDIEFQDITSDSGLWTYARSLFFVLSKALKDILPNCPIRSECVIGFGIFCRTNSDITDDLFKKIDARMKEIIGSDLPFVKVTTHTQDAIELFKQHNHMSRVNLLKDRKKIYTSYYMLDGEPDYYYGPLLRSTGQLRNYAFERYHDGLLLRIPNPRKPDELVPFVKQDKMLEVINEQKQWQEIIGISTVGELNVHSQLKRNIADVINLSEALQEKKIAKIAETIKNQKDIRLILIAGPSSSGKTTFSKRLRVQLITEGIIPYSISMDDYFLDRAHTPLDEKGDYDFESIYALDIQRLQDDINALLAGKEVELPKFDFTTGSRVQSEKRLKLGDNSILIMEGIHGLNPELTRAIPKKNKYKIFVSALTTILLDYHNFIPSTDNRLLRRIVRDYKYRNCSAEETIRRWPSVLRGEIKWIIPYQEEADVMFNSALLFELAGLRTQALPLLEAVPENVPEYSEAYRLRKFLNYILPIKIDGLPPTSLLREFMGGSTFTY